MATNIGAFQVLLQLKDELTDKLKGPLAALVGVGSAVGLITKALEDQAEAEAGINKLNQTLAAQGRLVEGASQKFQEMAGALTEVSTFTDDSILALETQFIALGRSEDEVQRLTKATVDYATYSGQSLESASSAVIRGLRGQDRAFREYGIQLDEGADKTTIFNQLVGQMESRFAGSAQLATQTMTGQLTILKREIGELTESLGKFIGATYSGESALTTITKWVKDFANFLSKDAILAMSEFSAQWREMVAKMIDIVVPAADMLAKLPFFGKASHSADAAKTMRELSAGLKDAATKLREAGDASAFSAGKTHTLTNKTKEQVAMEKALADSIERTARAREKAAEALERQTKLQEDANKAAEEWLEDQLRIEAFMDSIPVIPQRNFVGMLGPPSAQKDNREYLETARETIITLNKSTIDWSEALGDVSHAFQAMGISADSTFAKVAIGFLAGKAAAENFKKATKDSEKAMIGLGVAASAYSSGKWGGAAQGAAFGSTIMPGWGTLIGAVAGFAIGWIGEAKKAREETNKLRQSFIEANGGLEALASRARMAGVDINKLFDAKNAKELQNVIKGIKDELDANSEAQEALNAAIDKYGITIEELGPKFQQQKLDEMAMALLKDFKLLTAAGVDNSVVLEKMSGDFNILLQTAMRTGASIPESLRGPLEKLLEMGLLVDENGNKLEDLSGVKFEETLTESMRKAVEAIDRLVEALNRIPRSIETKHTIHTDLEGYDPNEHGQNTDERQQAASGFHGWVTRPTAFMAGEAGIERVDIAPGYGASSGGMNTVEIVRRLESIEILLRGQRIAFRDMALLGRG